jgi:type II secretory pathway component PulJ
MDSIQEVIGSLESHKDEEQFSYRQVAKILESRRHNRRAHSNAEKARQRQLLSPQQEEELVKYIERCKRDGWPPFGSILQNFAGAVAK